MEFKAEPKECKTVLVIDDDRDIRDLIFFILKLEGYEAITAGNGQEAVRYLESAKELPSLIILDLMMPIMNGWEFRNLQKSQHALSSIPVIVATANGKYHRDTFPIDANDFIQKPIELNRFLDSVKRNCA